MIRRYVCRYFVRPGTTLYVCFAAATLPPAVGQESGSHIRHRERLSKLEFIGSSLKEVQEGGARDEVIERLAAIAAEDPGDPYVGAAAVRAAFHIAQENRRIQECLLRVISSARTNEGTLRTACRLLVYVADDSGRERLRNDVARRWNDGRPNPGLQALADLGDKVFLRWLKETALRTARDDARRAQLDALAKMVRMQESVAKLLGYLASDDDGVDRGWVVRQAMRHGAATKDVHDVVVSYLRRAPPSTRRFSQASLVVACDEYRLFKADDVKEIEAIRTVRQFFALVSNEGTSPTWATLAVQRRAEFYRIQQEP